MLLVDIYMYKYILVGVGLGGGLLDVVCMIKFLNDKFLLGFSMEWMEEYVVKLGVDCVFFIWNKFVFVIGIGNLFEFVELLLKGYYIILIKFDIFVFIWDVFVEIKFVCLVVFLKEIVK